MILSQVIVDAGVIVALLKDRDQWRDWCGDVVKSVSPPLLTCEAVIGESCFLLQRGAPQVLGLLSKGFVRIEFSLNENILEVETLIRKYHDQSMSFADACLVRMSELLDNSVVFTVDRDFLVYRKNGRQRIPLIAPFSY